MNSYYTSIIVQNADVRPSSQQSAAVPATERNNPTRCTLFCLVIHHIPAVLRRTWRYAYEYIRALLLYCYYCCSILSDDTHQKVYTYEVRSTPYFELLQRYHIVWYGTAATPQQVPGTAEIMEFSVEVLCVHADIQIN